MTGAVADVINFVFNVISETMGLLNFDLEFMQIPVIYWIMGFLFLGFAIDYLLR